jgi:SAM-dependent methyltransferase
MGLVDTFISNVHRDGDGVWRTTAQAAVSYPDGGHDSCHGVEDSSFWFAHRNRCIAAVIARHPPDPDLPFADIGGGNGYVAAMIQASGYRTILIEPGANGIAHARERGLHELVQASTVELQIDPGALGAMGLFDVIEHIEDASAALKSLRPALADGGKIYATVPAHAWLWSSVDEEAGHFRRYSRRDLRELFGDCGFDVSFDSYYFWPLPPVMYLSRTLPELMGMRRAAKRGNGRVSREHRRMGGLVDRLLSLETRAFRKGRNIPFGASCILVATKRAEDTPAGIAASATGARTAA